MEAHMGSKPSWGWRSLIQSRKIVREGYQWQVGDGRNIDVWRDAWLPNVKKVSQSRLVGDVTDVKKVADLLLEDPRRWDTAKVVDFMTEVETRVICGIPLGRFTYEDKIKCRYTADVNYTVKSGYETARALRRRGDVQNGGGGESSNGGEHGIYFNRLWTLEIPAKIKHFLWKCSKEVLPVQTNLLKRQMQVDPTCVHCNEKDETLYSNLVYSSILQVDSSTHPESSFMEWWSRSVNKWSKQDERKEACSIASFILWGIRKQLDMRHSSVDGADGTRPTSGTPGQGHWQAPNAGNVKINCQMGHGLEITIDYNR